jgi:hypothetical protein
LQSSPPAVLRQSAGIFSASPAASPPPQPPSLFGLIAAFEDADAAPFSPATYAPPPVANPAAGGLQVPNPAPQPADEDEDEDTDNNMADEEYVVEQVLGMRRKKGQLQVHIKWQGCDINHEDAWQPFLTVHDNTKVAEFVERVLVELSRR